VGFVSAAVREGYKQSMTAFLKGLAEAGFVDGKNVTIEYRWAEGHNERLPAMLADLVERRVSVIAATTTPAARAAKAATTTIPIVAESAEDFVQLGLVPSMSRPGGNITGVTQMGAVEVKKLEFMHELLPQARRFALLVNPAGSGVAQPEMARFAAAARTLGLELDILEASSEAELDDVFAKAVQLQASGLVIGNDVLFTGHTPQLADLAMRHRIAAVYRGHDYVNAGGLASYGTDLSEYYRLVGIYVGRILKGEKPADLPVLQPTKVELLINLKTAARLGIAVPTALTARADEVIE